MTITDPAAQAVRMVRHLRDSVPDEKAIGYVRAAYAPLLRQAVNIIDLMTLDCDAIIEDEHGACTCPNKADAVAKWSDREMAVCSEHHDAARDARDNDSSGDLEEIEWTRLDYADNAASVLAALRAALGE